RQGRRTVEESTGLAAALLGGPAARVLACATGRIGMQVPRVALLRGVRAAHAALAANGFARAAHAITTPDAFPKTAVRRLQAGGRPGTPAAPGKGAGGDAPELATPPALRATTARAHRPPG